MKAKVFTILCVMAVLCGSVVAAPSIEFNAVTGEGWSFDGATFSFGEAGIRAVSGNAADALVGASVYVPSLSVLGAPGGPYILDPTGDATILIKTGGGDTLLSGVLGQGELVPVFTIGAAYPSIKADITNVVVTNSIGSSILDQIAADTTLGLDFGLTMDSNVYIQQMIDAANSNSGGFSGQMTIVPVPAPGAVLLGTFGVGLVGWIHGRRRRLA